MKITRAKQDELRRCYLAGIDNIKYLKQLSGLQTKTIHYYLNEFKIIAEQHPDKLNDFDFFLTRGAVARRSQRYLNLMSVLPELVANEKGPVLRAAELYRKYALRYPGEYSSVRFYPLFKQWFEQNRTALCAARLKTKFSEEELVTLRNWRKGNDHRRWQVAVILMETTYTYQSLGVIAAKVETSYVSLRAWLRIFEQKGLKGLSCYGHERPMTPEKAASIEAKMDNLVHLVQQSPQLYGIDRASWKITDLAEVFTRVYGQPMVQSTVSNYLRKRGIRYKRSRMVISSPDPLFREKYAAVQQILDNLTPKEKFFSVDEYGPCSVRPKDGRILTLPGEQPVFKGVKKGKGYLICTCALELSTNQLTHFYSLSKDTEEMIKLIEVLIEKYPNEERLYISWDAASWHASKKLYEFLELTNAHDDRPKIELAPLPARAPYLNIIESVFSGMSKSVIRNSDYASVADCKAAIDRYFARRNQHFLENPKRAGRKIWGKEKVKPVFEKGNICKLL